MFQQPHASSRAGGGGAVATTATRNLGGAREQNWSLPENKLKEEWRILGEKVFSLGIFRSVRRLLVTASLVPSS
jgi:hypothetical protein